MVQAEVDRWNRENPGQGFEQYRRSRYRRLLAMIGARKRIYLDMKFWIWLRSPAQSPQHTEAVKLLSLLRDGVASGRILCPVSYAAFCEMMKQNPEERRLAQAAIMDELSLGVGLRNPFDTAELEYLRLFAKYWSAIKNLPIWIDPAWAPVGQMIVETYRVVPQISAPILEEGKEFMLESKWMLRMRDYALLGEGMPSKSKTITHGINQERKGYPRAGKAFQQLFEDELHGCLDARRTHIENAVRAVAFLFRVKGAESGTIDEREMRLWINLFREAVRQDIDGEVLPSQRVAAALHAAIRMDDARPLKENDLDDIEHSAMAVGYSDLFLTEDSFADLLRREYVRAVIPRHCNVVSKIGDAIAATQELLK